MTDNDNNDEIKSEFLNSDDKLTYSDVLKSDVLINEYYNDINNYRSDPNNKIFFKKLLLWCKKFENIEYYNFYNWLDYYEHEDPITIYNKKYDEEHSSSTSEFDKSSSELNDSSDFNSESSDESNKSEDFNYVE